MKQPILVLGSGQLGLMMAEAGARLGIVVDRMSPEEDTLVPGTSDLSRPLDVDFCLERYPVITAEREHLPGNDVIRRFLDAPAMTGQQAMRVLPDRLSQKRFLDENGVTTAPWRNFAEASDLDAAIEELGPEVAVKSRRGGYDGKGLWMVSAETRGEVAHLEGDAIIEHKMPFTRELSLVGARNAAGHVVAYPLTQNVHQDGILRLSVAPAPALEGLQEKAERALRTILEALNYTGVLAIEFFQVDGELYVNELAPRVHNSGHWTQEGADISQFALHLRAVCGLPMERPVVEGLSAMVNVLGHPFDDHWLSLPGVLHWYGKSPRPGRKLGHINVTAPDRAELFDKLRDIYGYLGEDQMLAVVEDLSAGR